MSKKALILNVFQKFKHLIFLWNSYYGSYFTYFFKKPEFQRNDSNLYLGILTISSVPLPLSPSCLWVMVDEFNLFISAPLPQNSHLKTVVEVGVPGKQCEKIEQ